jgi:peptidoglycan biosynthesis protein MviN/MurJ (putative lipid II flippase)
MTTMDQTERAATIAEERPSGPAAASILAAGIGALVLGILTTWSEASTGFADALQWNDRVGPLSGKTIISAIAYFGSWGVLHVIWRRSNPSLQRVVWITVLLIVLGLIGTFPKFFQQFE